MNFKDQRIAITGASGTLGRALIRELAQQGAQPIAITHSVRSDIEGAVDTVAWQVGQEAALQDFLKSIDILIINHGVNVHSDRTPDAIETSLQVNALSAWRLMEVFLRTIEAGQGRHGDVDTFAKEVWINTSEAEVNPAFSPLYETSKRLIGDLITLRRQDAPCVIRKLVLGPFKSNLNPVGVMSPDWVAKSILWLAGRGVRNILVTINPLTYIAFPIKEIGQSLYFKLFSKAK